MRYRTHPNRTELKYRLALAVWVQKYSRVQVRVSCDLECSVKDKIEVAVQAPSLLRLANVHPMCPKLYLDREWAFVRFMLLILPQTTRCFCFILGTLSLPVDSEASRNATNTLQSFDRFQVPVIMPCRSLLDPISITTLGTSTSKPTLHQSQ